MCCNANVYSFGRLYNYKTGLPKAQAAIPVAVCGADALKFLRDMRLASVPIRLDDEIIRRPCCKSAVARGLLEAALFPTGKRAII